MDAFIYRDIVNKWHIFTTSCRILDITAKVLCGLFVHFQQSVKSRDAMQTLVREYPAAILNVYFINQSKIDVCVYTEITWQVGVPFSKADSSPCGHFDRHV